MHISSKHKYTAISTFFSGVPRTKPESHIESKASIAQAPSPHKRRTQPKSSAASTDFTGSVVQVPQAYCKDTSVGFISEKTRDIAMSMDNRLNHVDHSIKFAISTLMTHNQEIKDIILMFYDTPTRSNIINFLESVENHIKTYIIKYPIRASSRNSCA